MHVPLDGPTYVHLNTMSRYFGAETKITSEIWTLVNPAGILVTLSRIKNNDK